MKNFEFSIAIILPGIDQDDAKERLREVLENFDSSSVIHPKNWDCEETDE